ncbi:MAG TPA: orotidine-5'-phosphate decarboxylase [Gemmatimonadaceae bacterium]|nr:orotidine-5'-phosphate decarboxylase [Gemmatimonadaceae bacterium]
MLIRAHEEPHDRVIVALDVSTRDEALGIVDDLAGLIAFYKIGYQLFLAEGMAFVRELAARGLRVFLDLKLDDVDETIRLAAREIAKNDVQLLTLHGGAATARAAVAGRGNATRPRLLSVTLLSSLDAGDLTNLGILGPTSRFETMADYVLWRATQAVEAGCDGLIASGETIGQIRGRLGAAPTIVSPGIRPAGSAGNEHKRSATPRDAIAAGADYLVVGRPIRDAANRRDMAERVVGEVEQAVTVRA